MQKTIAAIIILAILLAGCATPAPVPTATTVPPTEAPAITPTQTPSPTQRPTSTPEPTSTPIPTYTLSGTVFFDYNGNGLRDEGEAPIKGVPIRVAGLSTTSGPDGSYSLVGVPAGNQQVYVESPTQDPGTAVRYIALSLEAYQPIEEPIILSLNGKTSLDIALMQGWLCLTPKYSIYSYFDLDPRQGQVRNYEGDTTLALFPQFQPGTFDQHPGIDFACNSGDEVRAFAPGRVIFVGDTGRGALAVEMIHDNGYTTHYGHLSQVLVQKGDIVDRGDLIALCGQSGTDWPHIHFQMGDHTGEPIDAFHDVLGASGQTWNHWIQYNQP